ncbi:MAG TPA: heme-binding protein [Alphaproteobacteria bacterium]|nr:heme-binding protein [Alphaproteobacteria bacterium]
MAAKTFALEAAETIADTALAKGRELRLAPLTVAVLDAGGVLVVLKREDGSSLLRPEIAVGKAWGALAMGVGTRAIAARAAQAPAFIHAVTTLAGGRFVPVPGGVLIRYTDDEIVGAVGISGDSSDNDETCAVAGIVAAGFKADAGGPPR